MCNSMCKTCIIFLGYQVYITPVLLYITPEILRFVLFLLHHAEHAEGVADAAQEDENVENRVEIAAVGADFKEDGAGGVEYPA